MLTFMPVDVGFRDGGFWKFVSRRVVVLGDRSEEGRRRERRRGVVEGVV